MNNLENEIFALLNKIGVPHHLAGRKYIEKALILYWGYDFTAKEVYCDVAKEYHTTPTRVERSIRHAVAVTFNRLNNSFLTELFGNTTDGHTGKVTNLAFLRCLTQYLELQQGAYNNDR